MKASTAKRLLHDVLAVHAALWVVYLLHALFGPPTSSIERDWYALREVARSFVGGDWASLYADRVLSSGTQFFRYPPFVLYLIAPLGVVPPTIAYALVCVVQVAAAVFALLLLHRIRKPAEPRLNFVAVFGSAAMIHVILSGQNSAVLALVIAAAGVFWASGRVALAGACIGLLACKPNWLPVFVAFVLWRGGLRAGAATAFTVAALALSTYPMGAGVWQEFLGMTLRASEISTGYAAYKEITLLALLKSVFGFGMLTKTVWLLGLGVLAALVIRAIRGTRSPGRSLALITLLAVVANPYASFYDGLVLIVPGTIWLAHRDEYPAHAWLLIGAWIGAYWFWDMAVFYYGTFVPALGSPGLSAAGFLLSGWLVTEALARPPAAVAERVADAPSERLDRYAVEFNVADAAEA
jgi:glycosyl transferase family 87